MKKVLTLMLAACMLVGAATGASAIDFKAKGQWLVGFGVADTGLVHKTRLGTDRRTRNNGDIVNAQQRIRLQLDAVASEALSGTVQVEIGTQTWGKESHGASMGTNGNVVKVRQAYLDWVVPNTEAKVRMGLQAIALPNAAGGSAVFDNRSAAVVANYQFNENVGVTAMWMRPYNDNWDGSYALNDDKGAYLDNMDLFMLSVPLTFDGFKVTPWAMYGAAGKNTFDNQFTNLSDYTGSNVANNLRPGFFGEMGAKWVSRSSNAYGNMFWFGLPVTVTAWDPLNIEFDFNYGYNEQMGRFGVDKHYWNGTDFMGNEVRADSKREGWLAKALVEYKMDWGVPGIFGWYASGDDGNVKNGSERMPSLAPSGNFTSFVGDGNLGWTFQDYGLSYAGTWGIGAQIRDMSFVEDLKHTFRVAYWGGTNSKSMVKYMQNAYSWNAGWGQEQGPYLTTADGLLELNLVNSYQMYENLEVNLELGYIANFMDNSTWKKAGARNSSFEKQDAWKAQLVFAYSF